MFYEYYGDVPSETVDAFVRERELGRLVTVSTEVEQQMRLLARHQPEGGFRPVTPGDPVYRGAISRIAAVRLAVRARRAKFKLGQNRPVEVRARIVNELRRRGRTNDARAAEALQWTIDREMKG